jgi:hypothetical protein
VLLLVAHHIRVTGLHDGAIMLLANGIMRQSIQPIGSAPRSASHPLAALVVTVAGGASSA